MNHKYEIKAALCGSPLYCRKRDASGNCTKNKLFGKKDGRPDCFSCILVRITIEKDENCNTKLSTNVTVDEKNEILDIKIGRILRSIFAGDRQ